MEPQKLVFKLDEPTDANFEEVMDLMAPVAGTAEGPTTFYLNALGEELVETLHDEEELEREMAALTLQTEIDLLPQDSNALRMKIHEMLQAFLAWERKATLLSDLVMAAVGTGDGDRVIQEIMRQSPIRAENNRKLRAACTMDFRLLLLTSPDLELKSLLHWYPEYEGRARAVGMGQPAEQPNTGTGSDQGEG